MLVQDLDTPCAVVDLDIMENNLRRCQTSLDRHGLRLRPHIKTHKIPEFAHMQIRLGAKGVNCQKLGEAEVMADAGITDILLTYNLISQTKLDRLVALAHRADIKVVADSTRDDRRTLLRDVARRAHSAGSGRMRHGRAALRREHAGRGASRWRR